MDIIFEIIDKSRRKIRLTKEQWKHISEEHPWVTDLEEMKITLRNPLKINPSKYDPEHVCYYYHYNTEKRKYLFVAVRYLNGDGFVITGYYMRKI